MSHNPPIRRLYDGTRFTGLTVQMEVTDDNTEMWRIHYPDDTKSDFTNISRATDGALGWLATNRTHHDTANTFRWK